jgi:hypothetical protein
MVLATTRPCPAMGLLYTEDPFSRRLQGYLPDDDHDRTTPTFASWASRPSAQRLTAHRDCASRCPFHPGGT